MGCNEPSQDLPPGASFKDPTGVNAKNASGQTPAQAEADRKIGENAKKFGAEMNAKYGKQSAIFLLTDGRAKRKP